MADTRADGVTRTIITFLLEVGFDIKFASLSHQTFLPGITADRGTILIDEAKLLYPGDLLHEAGHLAVIPAEKRKRASGSLGKKASEEMMAIAWSYAASVHLGLEPEVVFHDGGYRGWSESLIENFTKGRYVGVSMLEWIGLTADKKRAREMGISPYPEMIKWML
ncbi:MAG TPA: hypothetical protein VNO14_18400 [Blastocatellia bacterium]|nr:hypothetical protein [Blastocatellia bacterium]